MQEASEGQLKLPIYLDHQATTPVDPRVLEAMIPFFLESYGNAASKNHQFGRAAFNAVESARENIGKAIHAKHQDICFTSGATESINLAIKGVFAAYREKAPHFITVATEHRAVLDCMKRIANDGARVTFLPVDHLGMLNIEMLAASILPETVMISVMAANNEIGVIQPLKQIGQLCREKNIFFMTDATQALGKIHIDVEDMGIDLLACSAHKLYGPKGIGALYCRRSLPRVPIRPLIDGGGHERGLRSGTLNVPGIVGFARALALSIQEMKSEQSRQRNLRDELFSCLRSQLPGIGVNGDIEKRLAGNLNVLNPGVQSEALIIALSNEVAISSGSACTTEKVEPSHVLKAIGLKDEDAHCSIRIGLGRTTTSEEIVFAAKSIVRESARIAELNR